VKSRSLVQDKSNSLLTSFLGDVGQLIALFAAGGASLDQQFSKANPQWTLHVKFAAAGTGSYQIQRDTFVVAGHVITGGAMIVSLKNDSYVNLDNTGTSEVIVQCVTAAGGQSRVRYPLLAGTYIYIAMSAASTCAITFEDMVPS